MTLGEIAEIVMGNSPPGESYNEVGDGVPLINGPVEFGDGDFGLTIKSKFTTSPTKFCRKGDLLLCVRGSTTGRTNIAAFDTCIGRGVAAIRAKQDQAYLNHFIRTQRQKFFASGNGSTFPSISQNQIAELELPLPPLSEQRRIADILDKADAIRRKRQQALDLAEHTTFSIYDHLIGDPVMNPHRWKTALLGERCDIVTGFAFQSSQYCDGGGVRLLRGANVMPDRVDWSDVCYWPKAGHVDERFRLAEDDVVLAMDRPWISTGIKVARVTESDLPCHLVQRVARLRSTSELSQAFIYFSLRHPAFTTHCGNRKTETTVPHISPHDIRSYPIPAPPRTVQNEFATAIARLDSGIANLGEALNDTDELFQSLVQRAFRGEL